MITQSVRACLILFIAWAGWPLIAGAQVIDLKFEKHTVIATEFDRRTNIVTTGAAEVPVTIGGGTSSRAKFIGTLKLNFPAVIPKVTNFALADPFAFTVAADGFCTISNRFNEQNFGATNYLVTQIRTFKLPCSVAVTNGPPMGAGNFPIDVKMDCSTKSLSSFRRETSGFDYIIEFESEVTLTYRNRDRELESYRFIIQSSYRAPGGPYLYAATNLVSVTVNRRFPVPGVSVGIHNQGTGDLHYNVADGASWLDISGSGTVARGQNTTLNGSIITNGLARGTYDSAITITADGAQPSVTVPVKLTVLGDEVRIVNIDPPPGTSLLPGSTVRFDGTLEGVFETSSIAYLILRIRDENLQTLRATSVTLSSSGPFRATLAVPENTQSAFFIPAAVKKLIVQGILLDPFDAKVLAETPLVEYAVSAQDQLTIINVLPKKEEIVADEPMEISADVEFLLTSRAQADLALRVFDQDGVLQATSVDPKSPSQFLRVNRSAAPQRISLTTEPFVLTNTTTKLIIKAVFLDIQQPGVLKETPAVTYELALSRVRDVKFGVLDTGYLTSPPRRTFTPASLPYVMEGGLHQDDDARIFRWFSLETVYDFFSDKPGEIRLQRTAKRADGTIINFPETVQTTEATRGTTQTINLDVRPPSNEADLIELVVELYELTDGKARRLTRSDPVKIHVNRIRLVPQTTTPAPGAILTPGRPFKLKLGFEYNFQGPESTREVLLHTQYGYTPRTETLILPVSRGSNGALEPEFDITLPGGAKLFAFLVRFGSGGLLKYGWAHSEPILYPVQSPPIQLSAAAGQTAEFGAGLLSGVASTLPRSVSPVVSANDLKSVIARTQASSSSVAPAQARASALLTASPQTWPDFMTTGDYVQFDPPIPENRTFSGNLVLRYNRLQFPDNPSFIETKLEIISFDPLTGELKRHATRVDPASQTATTHLTALASYYTLAVLGPFRNRILNVPLLSASSAMSTKLSVVNSGASAASLQIRAQFGETGDANTSTATNLINQNLAAGELIHLPNLEAFAAAGAWIQVRADQAAPAAFQLIEAPNRQDGLIAASSAATTVVLPDVRLAPDLLTKVHIVNPSRFYNTVDLDLLDSQGSRVRQMSMTLFPKQELAEAVSQLFGITNSPFSGYLVVQGGHELVAAQALVSSKSLSLLNGFAVPVTGPRPAKLYASGFITGGGYASELTLLNLGRTATTARVRALSDSGADLGPPLGLTLAAKQQLRLNLADAFKLPGQVKGSVAIDSSTGGLTGSLTVGDATGQDRFRSSFSLETVPLTRGFLPLVAVAANQTIELSVLNPNSAATTAMIKGYSGSGALLGSSSLAVAADGRTTRILSEILPSSATMTNGYFMIESDAPVFASAMASDVPLNNLTAIAVQPLPQPVIRLQALQSGNQILLSWPITDPAYTLQTTDSLTAQPNWQPATAPVTVAGDRATTTVSITGQSRFYRLIKR